VSGHAVRQGARQAYRDVLGQGVHNGGQRKVLREDLGHQRHLHKRLEEVGLGGGGVLGRLECLQQLAEALAAIIGPDAPG